MHLALTQPADLVGTNGGKFVQALSPVDNKGRSAAQGAQHPGHHLSECSLVNSQHLHLCLGGIGERSQDVENRAHSHLTAGANGVLHGWVKQGGIEKSDPHFIDTGADILRRQGELNTQGLQDVCTPALTGHRAVTVLGHSQPSPGNHESRRSGDVEGATPIPTGTAGIHQKRAAGANGDSVAPHSTGETGHLLHRLALQA